MVRPGQHCGRGASSGPSTDLRPPPPHSNNMLYPKEDKENRILLYAVSASQPGAPEFRDRPHRFPTWPGPTPSAAPSWSTLPTVPLVNPTFSSCPSASAGIVITSRKPTTAASTSTKSRTKWTN
ncbi:DNA-directed RNA polymerase II subunit RPB9 isoform X3 [Monodon monoceros]|uniref:DNA-directed RNA polymerase II subunit RPB9 isoform X3 n=1 Tax=Monodon monoceros TaxID=40151 RepID=UPI0010FA5777|nr:DNA-directed RNA polymerase II subunit RPB9 isoform X3 [Monodon monoceros]